VEAGQAERDGGDGCSDATASVQLEIRFECASDESWAAAGHEVAFAQFPLALPPWLTTGASLATAASVDSPVTHSQSESSGTRSITISSGVMAHDLHVRANGVTFGFDMRTGLLASVKNRAGEELMGAPFEFNFWRAPTDNDSGGVEFMGRWAWVLPPGLGLGIKILPLLPNWMTRSIDYIAGGLGLDPIGRNVSYRTVWKKEGWHNLLASSATARVEHSPDGSVVVRASLSMVDPASGAERAACEATTHICKHGHAWVRAQADVRSPLPSIARVGLRLGVSKALSTCSWLGRGPHENYEDRKLGARVGIHSLSAEQMHTPYIVPGENGLRTGVQWLAMANEVGSGLLFTGVPEMKVSVSPFADEQLTAALHDHELVAEESLCVCLDNQHMGVGGDDSWSQSVLSEYRVRAGTYAWAVGVSILEGGDEPDRVAQSALLAAPAWVSSLARRASKIL